MNSNKQNVIFICTHNSCRSQIAEGLGNYIFGDNYTFLSAGTKATHVDPLAIKIMNEINIDISNQYSKTIDTFKNIKLDYAITVCNNAHQNCPVIECKNPIINMPFQDPPQLAKKFIDIEKKLDCYRKVRDEIKTFIIQFHKNNLQK